MWTLSVAVLHFGPDEEVVWAVIKTHDRLFGGHEIFQCPDGPARQSLISFAERIWRLVDNTTIGLWSSRGWFAWSWRETMTVL